MLKLIKDNYIFYGFFLPVFIGSSFIISIAPLAVGFLGVVWFVAKKRYDYILIIFLLTLILANNRAAIFNSYEKLRIVFLLLLFFMSGLIVFRQKGIDQRVMYFLPFFTVGILSSFLFSPTMISSVFRAISYLILVASVFILIKYLLQDPRFELYEHLLTLFAISLAVSLFGALVYPSLFLVSGRLTGIFGNPDDISLFCLLAYVFVDHFRVKDSNFTNREILLLKFLILLTLFLTGSRNGYASLAIYIMLTIFLFKGYSGKSIAILLMLGAILVLTEIETLARFIPFLGKLIRPHTLETASGRSIVWPIAINEIYRQPWFGGGFSFNNYYMIKFATKHGLQGVYWYGVWNSYIALIMDTGILGLVTYVCFVYGVVRKSIRLRFVLPFLAAMAFAGIFESWVVSSLNPVTPFFFLFFIVISTYGSKYDSFSTA